jgi:hypothetical protein
MALISPLCDLAMSSNVRSTSGLSHSPLSIALSRSGCLNLASKASATLCVDWIENLPVDERQVWDLMEAQRRAEIHLLGAKTVKEAKVIPQPPQSNPAIFYSSRIVNADAAWMEEKHRLRNPRPMACAIQLVNNSMNALMTKMNKPRVRISNGSDRRIRIGRITAFTKPKIKATINNVTQSFVVG